MAKIRINGVIIPNDVKWIYDIFEIDATCPKDVNNIIDKSNGENLDVEINSPGGEVWSGSEIYTALKGYAGGVDVKIVGIAASMASVIAMAGNKVKISPTAQFMIHNTSSWQHGDYRDMQHEADRLENYNTSIANAYMLKSGMDKERLLDLMNKETWLNAQQAKELGFVDEIMFDVGNQLTASLNPAIIFPPNVINKIRNLMPKSPNGNENQKQNQHEASVEMERLELLKLRRLI